LIHECIYNTKMHLFILDIARFYPFLSKPITKCCKLTSKYCFLSNALEVFVIIFVVLHEANKILIIFIIFSNFFSKMSYKSLGDVLSCIFRFRYLLFFLYNSPLGWLEELQALNISIHRSS